MAPHDVVFDLVTTIATMGASDLVDFILGGVIGTLIEIAFRIYVDPGINWTLEKWDYLLRLYEQYRKRQEMIRDEEVLSSLQSSLLSSPSNPPIISYPPF